MLPIEILVIEDDPDILELVEFNLMRQGFRVHTAKDGESGLKQAMTLNPSLILLDIMLPGIDGLKVCRKLRENPKTHNIPIVMLTAKGEESDAVIGLEVGADDYIRKPFSPKEMVARVRAILRRGLMTEEESELLEAGPIQIDTGKHEVFISGDPVQLTLAEFKLLRTLITKPGRAYAREQLLNIISGGDTFLVDRNVDVHIRSLRKKMGEHSDFIQTIRGVGYKCKG